MHFLRHTLSGPDRPQERSVSQRIRLYGIGSPFHDDQAGLRLVESMVRDGFSPGIEGVIFDTKPLDRPGWSLLEHLRGTDPVILVDAMVSGASPGTILRIDPRQNPPIDPQKLSSHSIGVLPVLALGRSLGLLPPCLLLYGVEIAPFSPSESLLPRRNPDEAVSMALRKAILEDLPFLLSSGSSGHGSSGKQEAAPR